MIETKIPRFYPFSQQIYSVAFTKASEQANKPAQHLTISFTLHQSRIVRLQYDHADEIQLLTQPYLKDMMSRVIQLNLQMNNIDDKGCKIVSVVNFPKLKTLNLSGNKITRKGVIHLAKMTAKLSLVYLSANMIGAEGIYWLCKMYSSLRLLNIEANNLGINGIWPLLLGRSERMSQLISSSNAISNKTIGFLKKKYSFAQFYY